MIERYFIGRSSSSSGPCGAPEVEEQGIAGRHWVELVGVAVDHLPHQHIDELDAVMLEQHVRLGVLAEGDEIRLDDDIAGKRMAEQLVAMAGLGAAPLDQHALAGPHIGAIAALLEIGEEARHRHVERARQRLQGRQRGRGRRHSRSSTACRGKAGLGGKLGGGELQALAKQPHPAADRNFELEFAGGRGIGARDVAVWLGCACGGGSAPARAGPRSQCLGRKSGGRHGGSSGPNAKFATRYPVMAALVPAIHVFSRG